MERIGILSRVPRLGCRIDVPLGFFDFGYELGRSLEVSSHGEVGQRSEVWY